MLMLPTPSTPPTVQLCSNLSTVMTVFAHLQLWGTFAFCYSPPPLVPFSLISQNGTIIDTVLSQQGFKQGCVLGSLGYAHLFQPEYKACVSELKQTTIRAIVDDVAITCPPWEAVAAYDSFIKVFSQTYSKDSPASCRSLLDPPISPSSLQATLDSKLSQD